MVLCEFHVQGNLRRRKENIGIDMILISIVCRFDYFETYGISFTHHSFTLILKIIFTSMLQYVQQLYRYSPSYRILTDKTRYGNILYPNIGYISQDACLCFLSYSYSLGLEVLLNISVYILT